MATDRQTVEQLVYEHGNRLYTFCRRLTLSSMDADDLYQQTYLRILDMRGKVDLKHNPAGFLMSVAARIWQDERKKYARRQRIAPLQHDNDTIDHVPDKQLTEVLMEKKQIQSDIRTAVQHLSDILRAPVLLYYMGDLPIAEIGKVLHIPEGTVKSRLHQARQKLRTELEEIGYDGKTFL